MDAANTPLLSLDEFDEIISVALMDLAALDKLSDSLAQRYQVEAVLATSEIAIVAGAYLGDKLGVDNIGYDVALRARNKSLMAQALRKHRVPIPKTFLINHSDEIENALEITGGYPLICKPLMGFASQGVCKVDNKKELLAAIKKVSRENRFVMRRYYSDNTSCQQLLVQEYISGSEFAIDGVVIDGNIQILVISEKPYLSQGPHFEDRMHVMPAKISSQLTLKVKEICQDAVNAIGLNHSPFHVEVKLNHGKLYVIEIAARSGFIKCLKLLYGINTCKLAYALQQRKEFKLPTSDKFVGSYCIVPAKGGCFKGIINYHELLLDSRITEIRVLAKPNSVVLPPPHGSSYIAIALAKADSHSGVKSALDDLVKNIQIEIV